MTPREQRALRAIEEALAAEDPALAELMRRRPQRRARLIRWVTWVALTPAAIVLLVGLALTDAALVFAGLVMCLALVAILRWAAPSARRGGGRA